MKKAVILGALAANSIALSGCSLVGDKTVFLQCVHEPSGYVMEYKIEDGKIWSKIDDAWKLGSEIKFSESLITYRDYFNSDKKKYNEYTLNRMTGDLSMSTDLETAIKLPVHSMNAKCSIVDESKFKF